MVRNGVRSGACSIGTGFVTGGWGAGSPQEFDETFLKIMAGRDDSLDGGGPNDQYTFIPLRKQ